MAKKVTGYIKLQIPAGKANPAPPIGPALGQHGVNIMEFCKAFNAKTANDDPDMKVPVVITVFADRSFTFETKTPPAADLIRKASGIAKGSGKPNREKAGTISPSIPAFLTCFFLPPDISPNTRARVGTDTPAQCADTGPSPRTLAHRD